VKKEITMESVFFEGFRAAYVLHTDDVDGAVYYADRKAAWLKYVTDLETPDVAQV
jgi:hypothetical protein